MKKICNYVTHHWAYKNSVNVSVYRTTLSSHSESIQLIVPISVKCSFPLWPRSHRYHYLAESSSQMPFVWKVQVYQGPQIDVMKHLISSTPRVTCFLGDTIKAMASMGKWLNATYMRLVRCEYICHDFKYLTVEHLILRLVLFFFFLYTLYMSNVKAQGDSENDSECLNWSS